MTMSDSSDANSSPAVAGVLAFLGRLQDGELVLRLAATRTNHWQ
ncbi:MAG TPA: hypothetical protein VFY84_15940 [Jiangellales bacterium]|nr:hypothetical protein [Jiangellales bacterium]